MSLSVVVPIYNELENIPLLYQAVSRVVSSLDRPYEIILVNDGSTDGSCEALDELTQTDPRVKVIEFRKNYGQTAAMEAGIQAASYEVIAFLDGDLQNDPNDLPMMLAKLEEGYDLVHGWRKNRQDRMLSRKLPSKIANWLISKVTRFPIHDLGCTSKVIRTEIAQELRLYGEMHRFIPILAHWRGARCVEVVTNHYPRKFGVSKYGLSRTLRVLLDLMTVKFLLQYVVSPMKLFGAVGLFCFGVSLLAGTATIGMKWRGSVDMTGNPLLLLTAISSMMGLQFLLFGLLSELCSRTFFAANNQTSYTIRKTWNFEQSTVSMNQNRAA